MKIPRSMSRVCRMREWEWKEEEEKLSEMRDEAMETIETTKNAAGKVRKKLAINVRARDATPQAW